MSTEVETDEPTTINGLTLRPSVRKAWVEALRSGEYKQAHDALRSNGNFCCLGVLCDLASRDGVGAWEDPTDADHRTRFKTESNTDLMMPLPEVNEWAGAGRVPALNPWRVEGRGASIELAVLNDEGSSFEYIADVIEGKVKAAV